MCPSWSVVTFLTISSLLHLLLPFADSNRSQHLVITEKDLKSSQIWKNGGVKLVLVKKDGDVIPDSYLHLLTEHFVGDNIPATLVEVECQGEEVSSEKGEICFLLSQHQALVRCGEDGINYPVQEHREELDFLVGILQLLIGESSVTHIDSYLSLMTFMSVHAEALLVLASYTNTIEYASFLKSYLIHSPPVPLAVISSVSSLPLRQRPLYQTSIPPLHIWSLLRNGATWYKCPSLVSMTSFIIRTGYPDRISFEEESKTGASEFQKKKFYRVIFFPALPGTSSVPFDKFVQQVAYQIYPLFVIVTADRKANSELAKEYFVTDKPQLQVLVMMNTKDDDMFMFELDTDDLDGEVVNTAENLMSIVADYHVPGTWEDDEEAAEEGIGKDSTLFITDFVVLTSIMKQNKSNDIVAIFCKTGTSQCPDEMFFTLASVHKLVNMVDLGHTLRFYVVECASIEEISNLKLNVLPTYAYYQQAKKEWTAGTRSAYNKRDILSLIADITGHMDLLDLDSKQSNFSKDAYLLFNPTIPEEFDVYGLLARTIPDPSPIKELVLTSDNFDERILKFERTAVLFHLSWSMQSKIALHHLMAAQERLDKTLRNVSLGTVRCDFHTDLCSRYGVTSLPSILLFTPSTLATPSLLPPSMGVLDSVHLLLALYTPTSLHTQLPELTPSSMPVLLKKSLTTPLVVWCDDSPSSKLGNVFSNVALSERTERAGGPSYAWINSSIYGSVLEKAFAMPATAVYPSVVAYLFHQRVVYLMEESALHLQAEAFRMALVKFLDKLDTGVLEPTRTLPPKKWDPVQPPIPYPSSPHVHSHKNSNSEEPPSLGGMLDVGKLDLDSIRPSDPVKFIDDSEDELDERELVYQTSADFDKDLDGILAEGKEQINGHQHLADEL